MIIEIEGYFNQALLTGKKCSMQQMREMYRQTEQMIFESCDFIGVFCRLYDFEQIPYSEDIKVDFVLDTDTGKIYSPDY